MKRFAAFPLWYFATLGTYFALADLTTTPRVFGFAVAAAVAALVMVDPLHLFWAQAAREATPLASRGRFAHRSSGTLADERRA